MGTSTLVYIYKGITLAGGWDAGFNTQTGLSVIDGKNIRPAFIIDNGDSIVNNITVSISNFIVKNYTSFNYTYITLKESEMLHAIYSFL